MYPTIHLTETVLYVSYLGVGALHEISPEGGGRTATLVVAVTVGRVRQYNYGTGLQCVLPGGRSTP